MHLVNSVNPDRIEGQKTAAYEVVEVLGDAPDFHFIPVGNAGNYTAYSRGYREEAARGVATRVPRMFGFQAAGSAPLVRGEVVKQPEPSPSAIRIGNPRRGSWLSRPRRHRRLLRRDRRRGHPRGAEDPRRRSGHLRRARLGISVAGLLERAEAGASVPAGAKVVLTVTGHGLKDPQWALRRADGTDVSPTVVDAATSEVASVLDLQPVTA